MGFDAVQSGAEIRVSGLKNFDIYSTFECGQCFRWRGNAEDGYTGIVGKKVIRINETDGEFIFPGCTMSDFNDVIRNYLDLDTDYASIIARLANNDPVMKKASDFAPGIRILRQPLFETLVSFIISANNSIPNIKKIIERLCTAYGDSMKFMESEYFSFPEPKVLAAAEETDIRDMKAGFRSRYIIKTAAMFLEDSITTGDLTSMGYENALEFLMRYPGVGRKVADCTLLFSGAFTNAFPVDTWVKKVMEEFYVAKDTSLKDISKFAEGKFRDLGGYAQQYLFYYARSNM